MLDIIFLYAPTLLYSEGVCAGFNGAQGNVLLLN
jgi:hypothetical protein